MKEKLKCDYCKEQVKDQVDEYPTWYGRYKAGRLLGVICKDCLPKNREKWRKGKF